VGHRSVRYRESSRKNEVDCECISAVGTEFLKARISDVLFQRALVSEQSWKEMGDTYPRGILRNVVPCAKRIVLLELYGRAGIEDRGMRPGLSADLRSECNELGEKKTPPDEAAHDHQT
jgi:hypothetical protein